MCVITRQSKALASKKRLQKGMQEKAIEFVKKGSEVYQKHGRDNPVPVTAIGAGISEELSKGRY